MRTLAVVLGVIAVLLSPSAALASHLPESDADSLEILHDYYPGYWWDHTHLTVAVQASPNVRPDLEAAVHDAVATWDSVLRTEFGGLITLTDVTSQLTAKHKADIVVHYVPRAGAWCSAGSRSVAITSARTSSFDRTCLRAAETGSCTRRLIFETSPCMNSATPSG